MFVGAVGCMSAHAAAIFLLTLNQARTAVNLGRQQHAGPSRRVILAMPPDRDPAALSCDLSRLLFDCPEGERSVPLTSKERRLLMERSGESYRALSERARALGKCLTFRLEDLRGLVERSFER